jgi:hypothetical protein
MLHVVAFASTAALTGQRSKVIGSLHPGFTPQHHHRRAQLQGCTFQSEAVSLTITLQAVAFQDTHQKYSFVVL